MTRSGALRCDAVPSTDSAGAVPLSLSRGSLSRWSLISRSNGAEGDGAEGGIGRGTSNGASKGDGATRGGVVGVPHTSPPGRGPREVVVWAAWAWAGAAAECSLSERAVRPPEPRRECGGGLLREAARMTWPSGCNVPAVSGVAERGVMLPAEGRGVMLPADR